MVILLYSDINCEHQAISCIKSFESKITDDIKICYFTIGFDSNFVCKNLFKYRLNHLNYPNFQFYKAELSLKVLEIFPSERYFIFTDTDILFSRRLDFSKLKHEYSYPLASFGPHEYPFIYEIINEEFIQYNEIKLMDYFNVKQRTIMYQWSCFYAFNRDCKDFLEEYSSMCQNKYLLDRKKWYFPFQDETAFNVCLWKRNATQSFGHIFVNTHLSETVKMVEETILKETTTKNILDTHGQAWEYIKNSEDVIFYHGAKNESDINNTLNYLLN